MEPLAYLQIVKRRWRLFVDLIESTYKDFTIVVDETAFGVDRDTLEVTEEGTAACVPS